MWEDFDFLALGDSATEFCPMSEGSIDAAPLGPPSLCPPPEKGMNGAGGAEETEAPEEDGSSHVGTIGSLGCTIS